MNGRMEEYANEIGEYEEDQEEMLETQEGEEETEEDLQQRVEAADIAKLFRQHPEIWIPYEEHVLEQLHTRAPGTQKAPNLSFGVRNASQVDENHTTYPFLTNYERTKILSFRASQICNGAKPYIFVPEGVTDAYEIAKLELEAKRLPFILKRPLPDGRFEVWRLSDLVVV